MIRDPFYQDIIRGLNGRLDPELFEQCATAMLRDVYPGLVPVRGGSDAGMDGAVSDGEGVAFPLVATTGRDVIGNLTRSLNSYLENGGSRRNVVLATSQSLSPTRRSNLGERAASLGFTLIQVHSQEAIADLLYRDPPWCEELLGLTGQPPALSVLPVASRPQVVEVLIGREDDLAWLEATGGDLLLIGQPGSGKTFLLHTFAKRGRGLFVTIDDPAQIAASVRQQAPEAIIVDDAHVKLNLLDELRHLRTEILAEYRVVATCWPGQRDELLQSMQPAAPSVHELGLLTRDQIVELVNAAGIAGPTGLIRELVDQAEGRPGLAATLCHLCIRGDVRQVAFGDALSRDIRTTYGRLLRRDATEIVAAFSLGGNAGMPMTVVAASLGLNLVDVRQVVSGLAAGGVLTDVGQDRLSVRPPSLRYALVRDVFFSGATSLPSSDLIGQSPDADQTALTLIGARARGAVVPDELLVGMVSQSGSERVWEAFSYLGPSECTWVLEDHPDRLPVAAEAALNLVPQVAVPLLLNRVAEDSRPVHSYPDHPLRRIEDWVASAEPGTSQVILRRETLLNSVLSWFRETGNAGVALRVVGFVLSPVFADVETSPGSGLTATFRRGLVTRDQMSAISEFWPRVTELLQAACVEDWGPMFDLMHAWLYPGRVGGRVSDEVRNSMRDFAYRMAVDIIDLNTDHPGVLSRISRVFRQVDPQLPIDLDPEFDVLYPTEEWGPNWREAEAKQSAIAEELAKNWAAQAPDDIAGRMVTWEEEARAVELTWPRWSAFVAERIAAEARSPSAWAHAFIQAGAVGELVAPFLGAVASADNPDYPDLLRTCLEEPRLQHAGVSVGLTATFLPEGVLPAIVSALDGRFKNWIEITCTRLEIPEDRVAALLNHSDCAIAAASAIGEWQAPPTGTVRESLRRLWRTAVVNCLESEYEGEEIFRRDPSIAFEWLQLRLARARDFSYRGDNLRDVALQVIDLEQRKQLLEGLRDDLWLGDLVRGIVGDELAVYRILLQKPDLRPLHLVPLEGNPTGVWIDKALLALDAGHAPADVAQAVHGTFQSWSGSESAHHAEWAVSFEPLLAHEDPRIRAVGEIGKNRALAQRDRALARERLENIYGR